MLGPQNYLFNRAAEGRCYRHFFDLAFCGVLKKRFCFCWGSALAPSPFSLRFFSLSARLRQPRALCEKKRKEKGRHMLGPQNYLFNRAGIRWKPSEKVSDPANQTHPWQPWKRWGPTQAPCMQRIQRMHVSAIHLWIPWSRLKTEQEDVYPCAPSISFRRVRVCSRGS